MLTAKADSRVTQQQKLWTRQNKVNGNLKWNESKEKSENRNGAKKLFFFLFTENEILEAKLIQKKKKHRSVCFAKICEKIEIVDSFSLCFALKITLVRSQCTLLVSLSHKLFECTIAWDFFSLVFRIKTYVGHIIKLLSILILFLNLSKYF